MGLVGCWSLVGDYFFSDNERGFYACLPNSAFGSIMLVAWNWS